MLTNLHSTNKLQSFNYHCFKFSFKEDGCLFHESNFCSSVGHDSFLFVFFKEFYFMEGDMFYNLHLTSVTSLCYLLTFLNERLYN